MTCKAEDVKLGNINVAKASYHDGLSEDQWRLQSRKAVCDAPWQSFDKQ